MNLLPSLCTFICDVKPPLVCRLKNIKLSYPIELTCNLHFSALHARVLLFSFSLVFLHVNLEARLAHKALAALHAAEWLRLSVFCRDVQLQHALQTEAFRTVGAP